MPDRPPELDLYEAIREQYPPVLTTAQVGELLNIGPRTVLAMALDGRLRASKIPGTRQYNYFREDVIRVLDENMVRPGVADVAKDEKPVAAKRARSAKKAAVSRRRRS